MIKTWSQPGGYNISRIYARKGRNMPAIFTSTDPRTQGENYPLTKKSLHRAAREWDGLVRRELRQFARLHWPEAALLGWLPLRRYRMRRNQGSETYVWWIEHDIPPYDRYRCEAYGVELSQPDPGQLKWIVRSGDSSYAVAEMSREELRNALERAERDAPLIIARQFEAAMDP